MIRNAKMEDINDIMQVFRYARAFMARNGNPNQWGNDRPDRQTVIDDIQQGNFYVIEEAGQIQAVFAFILGVDPTYRQIDGAWHSDCPYGTIHRIASAGNRKGVLAACLDFCGSKMDYLRIDTHEDNCIMQHLVEKYGFRRCGIIKLADGSPRIAYDRI